jgi:uncharacterized protein (TIGR02147 family)
MSQNGITANLFEYDNYRLYLRDYYAQSKATNKKFSYRFFSNLAGLKSPNVLKRVIEEDYNLSEDTIQKFAKALRLTREEKFYFENLVLLNQSQTLEDKQLYAEKVLQSRSFQKLHPLVEEQSHYFSQWYFVAIREFINLPIFQKQNQKFVSDELAESLIPAVKKQEAESAINELLKLGLLTRDRDGHFVQTNTNVITPDGVMAAFKAHFLTEMMRKAKDSIDLVPREKRDISSVTVSISSETINQIKEMVVKFREEVIEVASRDQAADVVYQLNLQLFPLTKAVNK